MTTNGKQPLAADTGVPTLDVEAVRRTIERELEVRIQTVIGTAISGLLTVNARTAPPDALLTRIARACGQLLTASVGGDLDALLALRKRLKDSFADGVATVDISKQTKAPPPRPQPPQPPQPLPRPLPPEH